VANTQTTRAVTTTPFASAPNQSADVAASKPRNAPAKPQPPLTSRDSVAPRLLASTTPSAVRSVSTATAPISPGITTTKPSQILSPHTAGGLPTAVPGALDTNLPTSPQPVRLSPTSISQVQALSKIVSTIAAIFGLGGSPSTPTQPLGNFFELAFAAGRRLFGIDTPGMNPTQPATTDAGRLGGAGAAAAAVALPSVRGGDQPDGNAVRTRNFDLINQTPYRIKLDRFQDGERPESGSPDVGSTLESGATATFEISEYPGSFKVVKPVYYTEDGNIKFEVYFQVPGYLSPKGDIPGSWCTSSGGSCSPATGKEGENIQWVAVTLTPQTFVVGPDKPKVQADLLLKYCNGGGGSSTCSFQATRQELTTSNETLLGNPVENRTPDTQSFTVGGSETVGYSDSIQIGGKISASTPLFKLINAEINGQYQHVWNYSRTISQTENVTLRPGWWGWLTLDTPVDRVYGDFTIKLGNVTMIVKDVYFDTPRPNVKPHVVINSDKLKPTQSGSGTNTNLADGQPLPQPPVVPLPLPGAPAADPPGNASPDRIRRTDLAP
jgi:hypothetical protein